MSSTTSNHFSVQCFKCPKWWKNYQIVFSTRSSGSQDKLVSTSFYPTTFLSLSLSNCFFLRPFLTLSFSVILFASLFLPLFRLSPALALPFSLYSLSFPFLKITFLFLFCFLFFVYLFWYFGKLLKILFLLSSKECSNFLLSFS